MTARIAVALTLALAFVTGARADADPEPKDGKVTITMTLSPAAPPIPVSRAYLFPEYRDMRPGNRVHGLIKTFMEQDAFYAREQYERRHKWLETPLADLPADVRKQAAVHDGLAYDHKFATMMVRIDLAARYTHVDWDEWFDLRTDGIYYLLPEVQKFRELARVVLLRMRGEVKTGEFDRAIESARTLFGMARALDQHPTLIGYLVGVAIGTMAASALEEMVQQPGCPNLYWSLADLPSPVFSLRQGTAGERTFLIGQFGELLRADRPWSEDELARQVKVIEEMITMSSDGAPSVAQFLSRPRVRYALFAADAKRVEEGRKAIAARGKPADVVAKFPPLQVVLLADLYRFEVLRDELMKWMNLPFAVAVKGLNQTEAMLKREKAQGESILGPRLLPAIHKVKQAEARIEQRFALLRTIEAIRLYAHENGGKLPAALANIPVPLPPDPVTGKPFTYSVTGDVATLHGENPLTGSPQTNRHFEIRIRK